MQVKVQVLSEETNSYQGQRGLVSAQRLAVLDLDTKARFTQTFDYDMDATEKEKYTGKLVGKVVVLGVTDFMVFGGRFRARGSVLEVVGESK